MSTVTDRAGFTTTTTDSTPYANRLLMAGGVAGPVLGLVWLIQGLVRDGYDFSRHPMSLLALGEGGWAQTFNFLVTGSLMLICAAGLRRTMAGGAGDRWAPRLVRAIGGGLIASGIFPTDAGAGFPVGAPEGMPAMSWHGLLHEMAHLVVVIAWIAVSFVFRRRFVQEGAHRWARASIAVVPIVIVLVGFPHLDSFPIRIVLASVVQLGYVGLVAWQFQR